MELTCKNNVEANLVENKTYIENGKIYLYLAYRFKDEDDYFKIVFPRIKLSFSMNSIPNVIYTASDWNKKTEGFIEDEYGRKYQLNPDENGSFYYQNYTERKMTLSDIEKELGYKVNIIEE